MPLNALCKNCSISWRLAVHGVGIFMGERRRLAFHWRSLSLLRKWKTKGVMVPRWPRRHIVLSSSFVVFVTRESISVMESVHAMNL